MPLIPQNALSRILTWADFTRRHTPAPAPGATATAAETASSFSMRPLAFMPVRGATPRRFRLNMEPIVEVHFGQQSWVETFLFSWPQANQDAMLDHEQSHYLITALSARDFFNEMLVIQRSDYPTGAAGLAAVRAALARYTAALMQAIQDKYDSDTHHDPMRNQMKQTIWSGSIQAALRSNQPLRDTLRRATLIP